jgi:hypothetical protein
MTSLSPFDRFVLLGTIAGALGLALIWLPFALIFIAAVAFALAAVIDLRTPPKPPEVAP